MHSFEFLIFLYWAIRVVVSKFLKILVHVQEGAAVVGLGVVTSPQETVAGVHWPSLQH